MSEIGSRWVIVLGLAAGPAAWSQTLQDIPAVDRQADDFYHAIATTGAVTATWSVEPTTVRLGDDITLTLTIRGAANPQELSRPNLRLKPAFTERFQVLEDSTISAGVFVYKLRPRTVGETVIPELKYLYYRLHYPDGRRFQTTYAPAVPITVEASAEMRSQAPGLDSLDEFMHVPMEDGDIDDALWWRWLPIAVALLAAVLVILVWRLRQSPSAKGTVRRSAAYRRAKAQLSIARQSADPAEAIAVALRQYLVARYGIPSTAVTPTEVARELAAIGQEADCVVQLLRECDAVRFSGQEVRGLSLIDRAVRFLEEESA